MLNVIDEYVLKVTRVYRQPNTTLQYSTSKLAGQNPESISQGVVYHEILARTSSRYQAFVNLLWNPSEVASQKSSWNQMSLQIYHDQTPSAQVRQ